MRTMRVTMAMIMAALVPLWCCCAAGAEQAARLDPVVESANAHGCCDKGGEKPAPAPVPDDQSASEHEPCECSAVKPQPPVVSQPPALPGLELIQSLLAFAPQLSSAMDADSVCCTGHGPVMSDGLPATRSLLSQHTLLLN